MADDVHLDKPSPGPDPGAWAGRTLGEVLEVQAISRVIVLRAATSAPAGLDLDNIRKLLRNAAQEPLEAAASPSPIGTAFLPETIWHAVLVAGNEDVYELVVGYDAARRNVGCLLGEGGHRGCFVVARTLP